MRTNPKNRLLVPLALLILLGCSNKAAEEKRIKDCLYKDEAMKDSIAKVEAAAVAEARTKQDSLTLADNLNSKTNTPKDRDFIKTATVKFRVNNVPRATERIEDITAKFGGYVKSSNLVNRQENYSRDAISKDSALIRKQITVENSMVLRVPNEKLDSVLRAMNPLISFLDFRTYNMDDVTYRMWRNLKDVARFKKYEQRQSSHIDNKPSKLKETTAAEDNLLDKQRQSDESQGSNLDLMDQVKYCTVTLNIYQKPLIIKEVEANFDSFTGYKPGFFTRLRDSITFGWQILEEIVLFIFNLWSIIGLLILAWLMFRIFIKPKTKTEQ
ncbi:MAG TPA: DUF4349 domain-containing protein [Bacteroidales bacterium]